MTNSIQEIREAEFLFVIGSNTSEAHPVIAMEMKRAVRSGARLVVADPRSIWLTSIAQLHLKLRPGTDVWLLNAMAQVIVEEGLADEEFIAAHTEGYGELREALMAYTPEGAQQVTDVAAEDIRRTAREYARTEKAGIYYTLGITEHTHGTDNVYALSNLVLMTGHLGKRSAGLNPLRGQNNVQGANDAGASPVFLPGYQPLADGEARRAFSAAWGSQVPAETGLNLNQMMKELGTGIRGLFVMGEDLLVSEPNVGRLEEAMNAVEFMVVQDILPNETMRFAQVVLPAACFAEKEGVFTNSERRAQRVRAAVAPPGEARADWRMLVELARAAGAPWPAAEETSAARIYAEMCALAPEFAGLSHGRLDREGGLQWPCPDADHPGTVFLHEGGVLRGKGRFKPVEYRPSVEAEDAEYPFLLSTGRTLYHYNAATQTRVADGARAKQPECFVEVHPADGRRLGLVDGAWVEVSSRRGSVRARALMSRQVKRGVLWMPLHFREARANLLTLDEGDAVTGTAEYKVCAAKLEALPEGARQGAEFPGAWFRGGR